MRRILFLTFELPPELPGGIASVAVDKISGFRRHGYRVYVVGPSQRIRFSRPEFRAPFFPIPVYRNPLKFVVLLAWAVALCLFERPQFVYSMSGTYSGMVARILARTFRVPYFVMAHGNEFIRFEHSPRPRRLIRSVYRSASAVFAVSDFTAREVARIYRIPTATIHTVYNGVDPVRFSPAHPASVDRLRTDLSIPDSAHVVLTVGRIDERKGHETVLRALALLRDSGATPAQIRYLVVGSGPHRSFLEDLMARLGVSEFVKFVGFVQSVDLSAYYTVADLFVMPTSYLRDRGSVEGFGLVYVEAGLCGTPGLGTRAGGVGDAIVDGETGYLLDDASPQTIVDRLLDLIARPEHYRNLGGRARDVYLGRFTTDRVLRRELEVINHATP